MADLISTIGQGLGAVGGPLVSGGLNIVGGLLQGAGQQSSINQQESFQEQMSDTAYQRSAADMTKAGLNPALMYGSGGAESSPSGSSATPPPVLQGAASSAMDAITAQKQWDVMQSQIGSNNASAAKSSADAARSAADIPIDQAEGKAAKTAQSLLDGAENFIQGYGKSNANPMNSLSNLFQSLKPNASNGPSAWDDLIAGLDPFDKNFMASDWKQ